jgi:hypothetical protein
MASTILNYGNLATVLALYGADIDLTPKFCLIYLACQALKIGAETH